MHFDMLALAYTHTHKCGRHKFNTQTHPTHNYHGHCEHSHTDRRARARSRYSRSNQQTILAFIFSHFSAAGPEDWRRKPTPLFLSLAVRVCVFVCVNRMRVSPCTFTFHYTPIPHVTTASLESMWKSTARGLGSFSYFKLVLRSLRTLDEMLLVRIRPERGLASDLFDRLA